LNTEGTEDTEGTGTRSLGVTAFWRWSSFWQSGQESSLLDIAASDYNKNPAIGIRLSAFG